MNEDDAAKTRARMIEKAASRLALDEPRKAKLGVLADKLRAQRNALVGATTGAITTQSPEVIAAMAGFYDNLKPEQQAKVREPMAWRGRGWGHRSQAAAGTTGPARCPSCRACC